MVASRTLKGAIDFEGFELILVSPLRFHSLSPAYFMVEKMSSSHSRTGLLNSLPQSYERVRFRGRQPKARGQNPYANHRAFTEQQEPRHSRLSGLSGANNSWAGPASDPPEVRGHRLHHNRGPQVCQARLQYDC